MPFHGKDDAPWWFSPTQMDIIAVEEIYQQLSHPVVQKIFYTMAQKRYPTCRPNRAKSAWVEPVNVSGTKYLLSCHIDENSKLIVVTYIRVPKK